VADRGRGGFGPSLGQAKQGKAGLGATPALFGLAILLSDFAGLRSLAFSSGSPWLVIFLLFFGLFITFGSVSLAANIVLLGRDRGD